MSETFIQTYTRKAFHVLDPKAEEVCIEDIAHQLSHQVRWTGCGKKWMSVAEHSVLVSQHIPVYPLVALLHDASEAYLPDLASPVKHDPRMFFYREAEEKIMRAIFEKFGLNYEHLKFTKLWDGILRDNEAVQLLKGGPFWKKQIPEDSPKVKIHCWNHKRAEKEFLNRFKELQNG